MKDQINEAINKFADGNPNLKKVLALFAAQMVVIVGKNLTITFKEESEKLLELADGLKAYFDVQ